MEAEEVLEVAEGLEAEVDLEGLVPEIQEVIISQGHMEEVLIGPVQDFMEDQGHLNTDQEHMEEEVHPVADHMKEALGTEGMEDLREGIDEFKRKYDY